MIDKTKYLYWLNDDEQLDKEVVWRELYSRFGYIFHVIQMVEYNIANILAIEEFEKEAKKTFTQDDMNIIKDSIDKKFNNLSKMTFGALAKEVEKSKYLNEINKDALSSLVKYRNYLAHQCFKEKLLQGDLKTIESVDRFVDEMNAFEVIIVELNEWLLKIFKNKKIKSLLVLNK